METVFLKPKSFLALNQHAHTDARHKAQFILHIHTHTETVSQQHPCSSNSQCTVCSVGCSCVCVHVMPSAHQGCIHYCSRNNDRRFYWRVRGPLILYWFNRLWNIPAYQSFCGVSAQHTLLPWWLSMAFTVHLQAFLNIFLHTEMEL